MKTATLPMVRVPEQLRQDAEESLNPEESMTSFITEAVSFLVVRRRVQRAFIDRGMASRDKARQRQAYRSSEEVLADLEMIVAKHERQG